MAKGLPDVIQKFAADNAAYLKALNENKDAVKGQVESLEEHNRMVDRNREAISRFTDQLTAMRFKLEDAKRTQDAFTKSIENLDMITPLARQMEASSEKIIATQDKIARGYNEVERAAARFEKHFQTLSTVGQLQFHAGRQDLLQSDQVAASMERRAVAQDKVTASTKAYYDVLKNFQRAPLPSQEAPFSGSWWPSGPAHIPSQRDAGGPVSLATAMGVLRGGGDAAATGAVFSAIAGGRGGGTNIFSGGGGGGGGGLMTAAMYADKIVNFAKRWAGAAHYAIMGTMEALSTIVPATVALGAAAAVSIQAGEQIANRGKATMTTAEALGYPVYGMSAGGMAGMGGALQQAQNRYGGGLYGLTGGLMTLAGMGQGGFLQMGGQTMAMMDRGMAAMVLNAQQRNTAGTLGQILGGGTQYLRQFGDIGANLGNFLLGMAPNLPGVGGDILSALTGITGGLAWGARNIPGPILGAGMAGEAGWRLGTPLIGLLGKGLTGLGNLAGKFPGGLLGKAGATAADLAKIFPDVSKADILASGLIGTEGTGLAGLLSFGGAALGGVTGPLAAIAAIGAWEGGQLGSYRTPIQQGIAARSAAIGNAPFGAAITPLAQALSWATPQLDQISGTAGGPPSAAPTVNDPRGFTARQRLADWNALHQFAQQTSGQLAGWANAAPQLIPVLNRMGIHGATFADALQIMTASLLDVNHAIDPKTHQLTGPAVQQVADFVKAITGANIKGGVLQGGSPAGGAGALMAGLSAQTIMGSSQMKSMANYNQALDSMTQIMTGGMAGQAALFQMLGGTPVTARRGGLQLAAGAAPATTAFAQALASPYTAGGAAAWSTFAGQGGLIPTLQQNLDQIRMEQSLQAISAGQGGQLAAFQLMQLLPMARHSPAALANLMSMGTQMGIPGMQYFQGSATSGKNLAAQFALAQRALAGFAPSAAAATSISNQAAVRLSNLPGVAGQFMQQIAPTMLETLGGDAITQVMTLRGHPGNAAAVNALVADLMAQPGMKPGMVSGTIGAMLGQAGGKMTPGLQHLVAQGVINWENKTKPPVHQSASGVIDWHHRVTKLATQHAQGIITYTSRFAHATPPVLHGTVIYGVQMAGIVGSLHGIHGQSGFKVPGYGGGDIVPAMLEPGEAVVPKHLVPTIAPFLAAHKVPGFQAGGIAGLSYEFDSFLKQFAQFMQNVQNAIIRLNAQGGSGGFIGGHPLPGGGAVPTGSVSNPVHVIVHENISSSIGSADIGSMGAKPIPAAAMKIIDAFEKTFKGMGNPWGKFASDLLQGLLDNLKNPSKETAKMAQALVSKVTQEVQFGKNTAASMVAGLNLPGMTGLPTPTQTQQQMTDASILAGGGTVSVQNQMGDYLSSLKSFSSDFGKLAKGHLNKQLLQQILSAGPVQGDALAQSILSGPGGVGSANKIYQQIQQQANALGIAAAQDIYGPIQHGKTVKATVQANAAPVHALQSAINSLHGKTVTITVNMVAGGGGGGRNAPLSKAEARAALKATQKSVLQQAKNNRRGGLQLPGYGS